MPSNDREAFQKLVSGRNETLLVDLLAYAGFSHERHRWIAHKTHTDGLAPDAEAENRWIADQPDHVYEQWRTSAINQIAEAAKALSAEDIERAQSTMARQIEDAKAEAIASKVVTDVKDLADQTKKSGGFLRQLLFALLTAALAPIIIGLVLTGAANYTTWVPESLQPKPSPAKPQGPTQ